MIQGDYLLVGCFFWTFAHRLEVYFQSLVLSDIVRGEVQCALEEAEALQDLSFRLRNRGVSEAEIEEQVEALRLNPASGSQAALPLYKLQANSHGDQSLGGSVGAPEDEELVLACVVYCGGFPSRTVPGSIHPYLSEAAHHGFLGLLLRGQRRRLLQLLPARFYICYDRVERTKRSHRLRGCYSFRLPIKL